MMTQEVQGLRKQQAAATVAASPQADRHHPAASCDVASGNPTVFAHVLRREASSQEAASFDSAHFQV